MVPTVFFHNPLRSVPPGQAVADVPTSGEFVPGYEAIAWNGIGAAKNTPAEFIDKLNKAIGRLRRPPARLQPPSHQVRRSASLLGIG